MKYSPVQREEYDCGIVAVEYLAMLCNGQAFGRSRTAEVAGTTEENGTSHDGIKAAMTLYGLNWRVLDGAPIEEVEIPSIVNYQWDGDGHYGVLIAKTAGICYVFNPGNGGIDQYDIPGFNEIFYSKRYGSKWSIGVSR